VEKRKAFFNEIKKESERLMEKEIEVLLSTSDKTTPEKERELQQEIEELKEKKKEIKNLTIYSPSTSSIVTFVL